MTTSTNRSLGVLLEERTQLISVLRDKDMELEDLEVQGATLSLPQLKTTRFNPDKFLTTRRKDLVVKSPVEFFSSKEVQNLVSKSGETDQKKEVADDLTDGAATKATDTKAPSNGTVVTSPPRLSFKRKVDRPDLVQLSDRNKGKKSRLNNL